jgi:predicted CoA-binding protein
MYDTNTRSKSKIFKLMEKKKTLVLGASANPARYSNLAINRLKAHQHPVVAIGRKAGNVAGIPIETGKQPVDDIDTITLYLNPANQKEYYDYIISLHPKRIIFNPGTENDELADLAMQHGVQPLEACTLVLLSTGQD